MERATISTAAPRHPPARPRRGRAPARCRAERRGGLRRDDLVGLAEEAAALGVADLGDADADLGELGGRDLAGEGARVPSATVLRPDATRVPANAASAGSTCR